MTQAFFAGSNCLTTLAGFPAMTEYGGGIRRHHTMVAQLQRSSTANNGRPIADPAILAYPDLAACCCALISDRLGDVFETVVMICDEYAWAKDCIAPYMDLVLSRKYGPWSQVAAALQDDNRLIAFSRFRNIEPDAFLKHYFIA